MKIDGLFIDYLISGGTAFLWIFPLTMILNVDPTTLSFDAKIILIAIPITYIVGMLIDYIAAKILFKQKEKARIMGFQSRDLEPMSFYEVLFEASDANDTLVRHLEMRETRVRTARGAFINFILASLSIPTYFLVKGPWEAAVFSFLLLSFITFIGWNILQKMLHLSYKYQAKLIARLGRSLNDDLENVSIIYR